MNSISAHVYGKPFDWEGRTVSSYKDFRDNEFNQLFNYIDRAYTSKLGLWKLYLPVISLSLSPSLSLLPLWRTHGSGQGTIERHTYHKLDLWKFLNFQLFPLKDTSIYPEFHAFQKIKKSKACSYNNRNINFFGKISTRKTRGKHKYFGMKLGFIERNM